MISQNGVSTSPKWKATYEAALLEADPTKLSEKIREARLALGEALKSLKEAATRAERQGLYDALNALADLERIYENYGSEKSNQSPVHLPRLDSV